MITGTIAPIDYLNAQKLHRKKMAYACLGVSGVAVVVGLVLLTLASGLPGFLFLGGGIGGIAGELITSKLVLPWKTRRLHSQQKDFASPITYSWDIDSFGTKAACGETKRPWKNHTKFKEDENLFLIYLSDNIFQMVPKEWFKNEEQISEFRELVKNAGT